MINNSIPMNRAAEVIITITAATGVKETAATRITTMTRMRTKTAAAAIDQGERRIIATSVVVIVVIITVVTRTVTVVRAVLLLMDSRLNVIQPPRRQRRPQTGDWLQGRWQAQPHQVVQVLLLLLLVAQSLASIYM